MFQSSSEERSRWSLSGDWFHRSRAFITNVYIFDFKYHEIFMSKLHRVDRPFIRIKAEQERHKEIVKSVSLYIVGKI